MLYNKQNKKTEGMLFDEEQTVETPNDSHEENDDDEIDEKIDVNLTFSFSIDAEDYCGSTLDDAIENRLHLPNTDWPNNIYREFMKIVMEY